MAKLDDLLEKKKDDVVVPILDLSKTPPSCLSHEDFRKILEKIPDFKIKPEKFSSDCGISVNIKEKSYKFKSGKKDLRNMKKQYTFMNPLPLEMQELKIDDLANVSIDWKMLTTLRPKNKHEENYFSRLVELGKLQNKSRANEKRQFQMDSQIRKIKNKSGVVEIRVVSCKECREDFCNGKTCTLLGYDGFVRQESSICSKVQKLPSPTISGEKPKGKIKRKSRSKSKTKRNNNNNKSVMKSKSPSKNRIKNK